MFEQGITNTDIQWHCPVFMGKARQQFNLQGMTSIFYNEGDVVYKMHPLLFISF